MSATLLFDAASSCVCRTTSPAIDGQARFAVEIGSPSTAGALSTWAGFGRSWSCPSPRPAEHVGVAHPTVADGVPEGGDEWSWPSPRQTGAAGTGVYRLLGHRQTLSWPARLRTWRSGPCTADREPSQAGRQQLLSDPAVCADRLAAPAGRGVVLRRDARADESARLESVWGASSRGFESHSLRRPLAPPGTFPVRERNDRAARRRERQLARR